MSCPGRSRRGQSRSDGKWKMANGKCEDGEPWSGLPAGAFPIRTDSPLRTTPYMNWLIIVANVIVFVAEGINHSLEARYGLSPRMPQLVQFFTYQFLHANPAHIAGNMIFLYIFGNNVNDKMGHLGYLAFYLAGGIFAGICYVVTQHGGQ